MQDLKRICNQPFPSFRVPFRDTLYQWAEEHLPVISLAPDLVRYYHDLLVEYVKQENPLFVVRWLSKTPRRNIYPTKSGHHFLATDNAPAVFIHSLLYHGVKVSANDFAQLMRTVPAHFHDVPRAIGSTAWSEDWSVRHIFNVKNGDVDFPSWNRDVLTWRFIRNVHPANYFCFPKEIGASMGEDPRVIAFFAQRHAAMFSEIWQDFVTLAKGDVLGEPDENLVIEYGSKLSPMSANSPDPTVRYSAAGLRFVRNRIELLTPDQTFRIDIASVGGLQFTKAQFYAMFPNVVKHGSYYWTHGHYVYTTVPKKALAYRVA